ncbi:MAG: amidohydrolase family protein [Chloroflexi bacterium]|nr:amidohydrolase family protein [Chloroflexota bacterium]
MPIIDFHTHIFPPEVIARRDTYLERDAWFRLLYARPQARMASADELIAEMNASGVDMAVSFGFAWADPGLCREANEYVLESVSRWPERLLGFAVVNPAVEGAAAELERCMQKGLHGLGELMPEGQGYALDDPCLDEVMQQMAYWKRPVLIHTNEPVGHYYPGKSKSTLQSFYHLAVRHPETTLVAAHWGGGLFFYELMPEVQQALRHVYYDTSASLYLYRDDIFPLAAQIIPQKMLFATDYPLISQGRFLQRIRETDLSADAREALLGGNAARLLHISRLE